VLLTAADGGIVNDAVLLRLGESHFWLSPGDGDALLWVQGLALHAGLQVEVREPDVSPLQLQGPRSPAVARALFGDEALSLGYYRLRETALDGIPLVLARTGWSGELGYELYLRDAARGEELWERVLEAGRPHGIAPIAPSTIRSVEGGILSYVSDIRREDDPFTLGLERLVDLEQEAEFVGKAALRRIAREGPRRRLVGLEIDGPALAGTNAEFWPVSQAGRRVGHVTRCVHSPRLARNIGLANVPAALAERGTGLEVEAPAGARGARVVATPFVEPKRQLAG
jgi:glycine cleavage system aminomethyltransferase T